jgi:hypothetical protein
LITSFSLGDSDANYNAITFNYWANTSRIWELLINGLQSNSTQVNTRIKRILQMGHYKNQLNQVVTSETITNGQTLISGANISQITVRSNFLTDSYVNLFYSLGFH